MLVGRGIEGKGGGSRGVIRDDEDAMAASFVA